MLDAVKRILTKYKSVIMYGIFGILTTVINIVSFWLLAHMHGMSTVESTIWAWIIAVVFSYLTNRKWVFESKEHTLKGVVREVILFVVCRLGTGILDVVIMYVFVDIVGLNDVFIKLISNILVIILNYVASKLVIFRKH